MICGVCGTKNPGEARFCLRCGNALARRGSEGERRIVTMLFCDVVGSTAMAERLDPEVWTEIMNEVFELLIAPIHRYEGTLARLMGDAIFAFFGAPKAHEDDPVRAVTAGLDIVEAIDAYRSDHTELDLNVRVGINTGPVVVGEVGSEQRLEYTAMGDAVNVAARMEQTADPGTVQITEETARLVGAAFDLGPARSVEVKGKAAPVPSHRVLGRSHPRRGVEPVARSAPLVGRDREMETLRRAVDETIDGRGQMVALIGEAGLGKSRLIEETRRYWSTRRPDAALGDTDIRRMWEIWQCVSFDRTRPYAQYRRMLAMLAGIADTDPPELVREKLAATVEPESDEWLEPHMRVWRSLFGVTEPGEELLEGEVFRDAIMDLVPRSTRYLGEDPRLLVFEDLHWCDDASMDLLIETARVVEDLPSLLVFAFRPDEQAPSRRLQRWMEEEHPDRSTLVPLTPLSAGDSGDLIDELLPGGADDIRAQILERTEGNPLFVEELAAAIGAQGSIGEIPGTLQALITARLDTLAPDDRRTLQLASVIGRSFREPVLGAVAGDGSALRERLGTLESAGLIRAAPTTSDGYEFHHSLTQEAAYGTILLRERKTLHLQVGEALERLYANRLEEFAPLLEHHFLEAADDERTLRFAKLAGDQAARLYANADAIVHYDAAIDAAGRLRADDELLRNLFPSRGLVLQLVGRYDDAEANYEHMHELGEASRDRAAELAAITSLTTLYTTATAKMDAAKGRRSAEEAARLAAELGDRDAESKALWNLMNLNVYGSGDLREAVELGERSLAISRELGAREQTAFTMTDLWRPYVGVGDLAAARRTLEEARPIWHELDNLPMLTENLGSAAQLCHLTGEDDRALSLATEARSVADSAGNLWGQAYASMAALDVHLDRGELGTAIHLMREAVEMGERVGFLAPLVTTRATLAATYAYLGDLEDAGDGAERALEVATERVPSARPWPLLCLARIHVLAGEADAADAALAVCDPDLLPELSRTQASLDVELVRGGIALAKGEHGRAIEIADQLLARLDRIRVRQFAEAARLLKGRALRASGDAVAATDVLREARSIAEDLGHRRILWEILAELAEVGGEERSALLAGAREIVHAMADTLEPDLGKRFLNRPGVAILA
jgi:class 3 adenylate cyclase/tetratricopeptide (TPR) repeat protein